MDAVIFDLDGVTRRGTPAFPTSPLLQRHGFPTLPSAPPANASAHTTCTDPTLA